jgi:NAD(P)-dependent dehydrogenase (short-subunit alcohol dehydrogenase family)
MRFVVNTLAPYLLTRALMPVMKPEGCVINLSSAAQAPVDLEALQGGKNLSDMEAYAQSKLAITIWSRHLASELPQGPMIVAVNPGSLLASKMVREAFGVEGSDLAIGADILVRAALSDEFISASGLYYDNDAKRFGSPHPDALVPDIQKQVMTAIEAALRVWQ